MDDGLHKGGQIIWLSARNELSAYHHLLIHPIGASVGQVAVNGKERGNHAALEYIGRCQPP